ncbi:MAG: hypothetical protein U0R19_18705 [Bryobacteraceae bacterium]
MAAVMALSIYRELPKVAFESQRLREELLIERGLEYRRAIQLFFRKKKQYPKDIDALEKDGNLRYLRKRYVDPMTGKDEWRLIHIGPNGEFTDSLVMKKKNPLESDKKGNQNTFISEAPSMAGNGQDSGPGQATVANRVRQSDLAGAPGQGVPGQGPVSQGMPTEGNPQQQGLYAPLQGGQPQQQGLDPNNPNAGMMPQPQQQNPQQGGIQSFPMGFPQQQQQAVGFPAQGQQYNQPVGYPPAPGQPPVGFNPLQQVIPGAGGQGIQSRIPGYTQPSSSQTGGVVPQPYPNPYQQQNPFQQPGYGQQQSPYQQNSGAAPRGAFTANPAAAQQIMSMITQPRPGGAPAAAQQQMGSGFGAIGGGVAGVASKFEAEGIKIFGEKTKYNEWEFLYDFQRDDGRGGAGSSAGSTAGNQGIPGMSNNPGNSVGGSGGFGNSTGGFGNNGRSTGFGTGSSSGFGNSGGGFGNSTGGFGNSTGGGFGNSTGGFGSSPGFGNTPRR